MVQAAGREETADMSGALILAYLLYRTKGLICLEQDNKYCCLWGTGNISASGEGAGLELGGRTGALMRPNTPDPGT